MEEKLREAERQMLARDRLIAELKLRLPASQDKQKINERISEVTSKSLRGTQSIFLFK